MLKNLFSFLHFYLLWTLTSACTHKEFYEDVKTSPVETISADEKSCLSKGFRWYWENSQGCLEKNFIQYCEEENQLPEQTKLTITVIKNETGKQDCKEVDAELKAQTGLYLNGLGLEDIYPLIGLTHLSILRLDANKISDLYPLSKLAKLRVLRLDNNNISKINHLSSLKEIVVLRLDQNKISNLFPLSNLNKVAQINLSSNKIKSIEPLANLSKLRKIGLKKNNVQNVLPLSDLEYLEYIDLDDNPISGDNFPVNDRNCPTALGVAPAIKVFCQNII